MAKRKLSFKKIPRPKGLAGVAYWADNVEIKLNGKPCGEIRAPSAFTKRAGYEITFMVKKEPTKENPAPFKWVTLKGEFETEEEARNEVMKIWDDIPKHFELHQLED